MRRIIISLLVILLTSAMASAIEPTDSAYTIADRLAERPNVSINQPKELKNRLIKKRSASTDVASEGATGSGYRIQIFSDNNPRTAKNEAHAKAAAIAEAFPHWGHYITYDSPYWRLRVGDFRTYEEAALAIIELKNAFPAYRRELSVVRDKIHIRQ